MLTDPKEVFVQLLSEARQNNEKATEIYQEIGQLAQDHPQIKELLEARAFLALKTREHLDHCFKLIGARPVAVAARHHEVFLEELRKHLAEIKSSVARHHFILAKFAHFNHIRIGEYEALLAADVTGHLGVGVLLEGAKAARVAFADRTRHLARRLAEARVIERKIAADRAA